MVRYHILSVTFKPGASHIKDYRELVYMFIHPTSVCELRIEVVIGWFMAYMCVCCVFTWMTRISSLESSFALVSDVEAGVFWLLHSCPSRRALKTYFFSCLSPK